MNACVSVKVKAATVAIVAHGCVACGSERSVAWHHAGTIGVVVPAELPTHAETPTIAPPRVIDLRLVICDACHSPKPEQLEFGGS